MYTLDIVSSETFISGKAIAFLRPNRNDDLNSQQNGAAITAITPHVDIAVATQDRPGT